MNPTVRAIVIIGALALIVAAVLNYGGLRTEPKPLLKFEPPKARESRIEPRHADVMAAAYKEYRRIYPALKTIQGG